MDDLKCFVDDPEQFKKHIVERAKKLNVQLPPDFPSIPTIYALLKLKPPKCSLQHFHQYMRVLFTLYESVDSRDVPVDTHFRGFLFMQDIFFCLDENFSMDDLNFLFTSLMNLSLTKPIPPNVNGLSLIRGDLSDCFDVRCDDQIAKYTDSARVAFAAHLQLTYFHRETIIPLLRVMFNIPKDTTEAQIPAFCAKIILPNVSISTGSDHFFQRAYELPLLHYDRLAGSFIRHIKNIVDCTDRGKYFASYTFLGQSSSVGKSRLLQSPLCYGDTALFILYVNCKQKGMAGIPPINANSMRIAELLMKCETEPQMTLFLRNMLYMTLTAALEKQAQGDGYDLKEPYKYGSYEPGDFNIIADFIKDYQSGLEDVPMWSEIKKMVMNMGFVRKENGTEKRIKIIPVVAFDEAACFIEKEFSIEHQKMLYPMNTFRLIRRSLRDKAEEIWWCPFIFAGTNTRFGNFVPTTADDISSRRAIVSPTDSTPLPVLLFDPYTLTSTWNVFAMERNYSYKAVENWKMYMESNDYLYHLSNWGRPIWGACVQAWINASGPHLLDKRPLAFPYIPKTVDMLAIWGKSVKYARQKVRFFAEMLEEERVCSAVALLSMLSGIGYINYSMASALVERQMAFLIVYRYAKGQMIITYPVEPVLSIAALRIFQQYPYQIIQNFMNARGVTPESIGTIGELVVTILFLLCIPMDDEDRPYYPVKTFLQNVLGENKVEELMNSKNESALAIMKGHLCMTYFTKIQGLSQENAFENIAMAVMFNAGLWMPDPAEGLDMVMPVVLETGKLASINLQVKSYERQLSKQ